MIYLASPYSHPSALVRDFRFRTVCQTAGEMMMAGKFVYSPIAHSHPITLSREMPTSWYWWEPHCTAMLAMCDEIAVLMLDGWKESVGVQAEIEIARHLNKPVLYVPHS